MTLTRSPDTGFDIVLLGSDQRPQKNASHQVPGGFICFVEGRAKAKLHVGDRILQVNGMVVTLQTCKAVRQLIQKAPGLEVELSVKHDPEGFLAMMQELQQQGESPAQVLRQALQQEGQEHRDIACDIFDNIDDAAPEERYRWPRRQLMVRTPRPVRKLRHGKHSKLSNK